jgi:hypothetical protein
LEPPKAAGGGGGPDPVEDPLLEQLTPQTIKPRAIKL